MTGRQFIGLIVVIAIFAVVWRLDHGKQHLVSVCGDPGPGSNHVHNLSGIY